MPRGPYATTSDYYSLTMTPPSAPMTLAMWLKTSSASTLGRMFFLADTASDQKHGIAQNSSGNIQGYTTASGITNITGTTVMTANTWYHAAYVIASATSRTLYVNGVSEGTSSVSRTPVLNYGLIGIANNGATGGLGNPSTVSTLAECCIWDTALTADDVAQLAARASPLTVKPANLQVYVPLIGAGTEIDLMGNATVNAFGSVAGSDDIRLYRTSPTYKGA